MADKIYKIYPGNNKVTYIPGILPGRGRLELPARAKLNEGELRKCMSYATVYEEVGNKNVLLTLQNYNKDNTDGVDTIIPDVELKNYVEEEKPVTPEPQPARMSARKSTTKPSTPTAPVDEEDE